MPKGDNKPWPWDELEVEWLMSKSKDFPFVTDFLRFKGIPENTGRKHTTGWQKKRDLIYQRAAAKAINRYENNVSKVIETQGKMSEALIEVCFQNVLECDRKGVPLTPLKFKKGFKPTPAIIQRLMMQGMGIQQRLAGVEGTMAGRINEQAPMKMATEGEVVTPQDSEKIRLIRQSPKLLEAAEKLLDAMGPAKTEVVE